MVRGKRADNGLPRTKSRKAKTDSKAPGAQGALIPPKPTRTADELRAGFLQHLRVLNAAQAKVEAANKILSDAKKALKADGYLVAHYAVVCNTKTGNGNKKIDTTLRAHREALEWIGDPRGRQLAFAFDTPDRTPSVDTAFDAGKQASMENQSRKPPHAPQTEQYDAWMKGYDAHQRELAGGFKAPKAAPAPAPEDAAVH